MQTGFPSRKRFSPAQKKRIIAAYRRSQITQREFCVDAGISVSALQCWLRQERTVAEPSAPPAFIPVPNVLSKVRMESFPYRLQFAGGVQLEIAHGFNSGELSELCQVVRAL